MLKKKRYLISLLFVLCLLATQNSFGQIMNASVSGRVLRGGPLAMPIAGATVSLIDIYHGWSYQVTTNSSGEYNAKVNVAIEIESVYLVFANKPGYTCNSLNVIVYNDESDVNLICTKN